MSEQHKKVIYGREKHRNRRNKIVKYCTEIHVPYQSLNRCHWCRWQWNGIICDMMRAVCEAGYAYPFEAPDFTSGFHRGLCCPVNCVSLFHVIVLSFEFCDCMVSLYFVVIWDWVWEKSLFYFSDQWTWRFITDEMICLIIFNELR